MIFCLRTVYTICKRLATALLICMRQLKQYDTTLPSDQTKIVTEYSDTFRFVTLFVITFNLMIFSESNYIFNR